LKKTGEKRRHRRPYDSKASQPGTRRKGKTKKNLVYHQSKREGAEGKLSNCQGVQKIFRENTGRLLEGGIPDSTTRKDFTVKGEN